MNAKVVLVARILVALITIVFGANKFLNFMPAIELEGEAQAYFGALMSVNLMPVIAIIEIGTGIALLANRYVGWAVVLSAPIAFNALWFHAMLDPANLAPAAVWVVLLIVIFVGNKDKFASLSK